MFASLHVRAKVYKKTGFDGFGRGAATGEAGVACAEGGAGLAGGEGRVGRGGATAAETDCCFVRSASSACRKTGEEKAISQEGCAARQE